MDLNQKVFELKRLAAEPDLDLIRAGTKPSRGECDGFAGSLLDYVDQSTGESFVQFNSDAQVGPSRGTVPALVAWFTFVEVTKS